jgi:hypothetical protein
MRLRIASTQRLEVRGRLPIGNFGDGRINIIAKHRHHHSS